MMGNFGPWELVLVLWMLLYAVFVVAIPVIIIVLIVKMNKKLEGIEQNLAELVTKKE